MALEFSFLHDAPAEIFWAENAESGTSEIVKAAVRATAALAFLRRKVITGKLWWAKRAL